MKISEVIETCKKNSRGYGHIDDSKTRDKVLYGDTDRECTGIVTTIYASVDVIKKAHRLGANLIISHEACFWNHGDRTDWLQDNKTFQYKKRLLDETGITVWREHDYIHAGILHEGRWVDGIFYGLAEELGWTKYANTEIQSSPLFPKGRKSEVFSPLIFDIPETPVREVAQYLMKKMNLKGMKTMGDLEGKCKRICIPFHIMGMADNAELRKIEEYDIDTVLAMEITDYTVAIYIRDSAMAGRNKRVLAAGHFNIEEPGMKWFGEKHLPELLPGMDIHFIQAGDSYNMIERR